MPNPLILCADDTPGYLLLWKKLLEEKGFRVLTACDGTEALEIFLSYPVDLALLDYHMREMNGDKVAEEMRARKPDVPIALLSADDCVPESALAAVDAFVSKSESATHLLEIVSHLLSLRHLFQPLSGLSPSDRRKTA